MNVHITIRNKHHRPTEMYKWRGEKKTQDERRRETEIRFHRKIHYFQSLVYTLLSEYINLQTLRKCVANPFCRFCTSRPRHKWWKVPSDFDFFYCSPLFWTHLVVEISWKSALHSVLYLNEKLIYVKNRIFQCRCQMINPIPFFFFCFLLWRSWLTSSINL